MEINKYNFLRWNDMEAEEMKLPKGYELSNGCYAPVMVPGEITSFFINCYFTQDFDFVVRILKGAADVSGDLVTLSRHQDENGFEPYGSIVCPDLPRGYYKLGIYVQDVLRLVSNLVFITHSDYEDTTALVKFRNDLEIYGVNYADDFYQQFRINILQIDRQFEYAKDTYRSELSRKLREFYSNTDAFVKFETYYFDEPAHEACAAMIDHEELYINGKQFNYKSAYKVNTDIRSSVSKGEFEIYEVEFSSDARLSNTNVKVFPGIEFGNDERFGDFTKNDCPPLHSSEPVRLTVPAGTFMASSKDAANLLAEEYIDENGQQYANDNGVCIAQPITTYYNTKKSGTFLRQGCDFDKKPVPYLYEVAAGIYWSQVSQEAADTLAQNDVNNNGQSVANTYGQCTARAVFLLTCNANGKTATFTFTCADPSYNFEVAENVNSLRILEGVPYSVHVVGSFIMCGMDIGGAFTSGQTKDNLIWNSGPVHITLY